MYFLNQVRYSQEVTIIYLSKLQINNFEAFLIKIAWLQDLTDHLMDLRTPLDRLYSLHPA